MSDKTGIEWTDATWNPIRGCSRVSEGCRNCYAEKVAARFSGPGQAYEGTIERATGVWNGRVKFIQEHLDDPLRWKKPRRIFVNSMSDLFHPDVKLEWQAEIFAVMARAQQHQFQILTKRPKVMYRVLTNTDFGDRVCKILKDEGVELMQWPFPNVWLGVSVEDQATADERIPVLLQTPAAVRFVSYEPALGPVDFEWYVCQHGNFDRDDFPSLDWIICGGESGHGARPMHPAWARTVRDQCQRHGVPFFFKQWGNWGNDMGAGASCPGVIGIDGKWTRGQPFGYGLEYPGACSIYEVGKKRAGRLLDGREWNEMPETNLVEQ